MVITSYVSRITKPDINKEKYGMNQQWENNDPTLQFTVQSYRPDW